MTTSAHDSTQADDERELCIMMGVCIWQGLSYLLSLSPEFRRTYRAKLVMTDAHIKTLTPERIPDEEYAACRLLLHTAPGWADWGNEPGYAALLARFPASTQKISFPYPTFPAFWPMHCWDPRNDARVPSILPNAEFASYPYGDSYFLALMRAKLSKADAINTYLALDIPTVVDLDGLLARNHQLTKIREQTTDIKIAGLVAERFRYERFFQTMNHPTNHLMIVMANQMLAMLGFADLGSYPERALSDSLTIQMPIHPSIVRHFGLTYVDDSTRYCIDDAPRITKRLLTYEEYLDQYHDFI